MSIENIRKELTREEFIKNINSNHIGCFEYKDEFYDCPCEIIGLMDSPEDDCAGNEDSCKKCWLNSIKDIKFKNELESIDLTDKVTKKYNKEEIKQYKASEIIVMIENNELINDDIIIDKEGDKTYIEDVKNGDMSVEYLLGYAPFTIKIQESVKFEDIILTDKYIKVKHELLDENKKGYFEDFQPLSDIFYQLGRLFKDSEIKQIIKDGQWFIEED